MDKVLKWGIIAPGRIAHQFAQDLSLSKNGRLHAVASRSLDRAKEFAKTYNADFAFGSYSEMLSKCQLDVVYVASPHVYHSEHSLLCLNQKIPVLCEKPLAMNLGQLRTMVDAARKNDTFLMEAIWTRFIPLFEKTIELVNNGAIGELKSIRADFGFKANYDPGSRVFDKNLGGGALLDVGIYPLFLAQVFFGRPQEISAHAVFGKTGADESCGMLLSYGEQKLAILDCSISLPTNIEAILYGETGTIKLHRRFHHPQNLTLETHDGQKKEIHLPYIGNGYVHEIDEVNNCLLSGAKETTKLPLDFSLQLMDVLDRTRQKAGINYPFAE